MTTTHALHFHIVRNQEGSKDVGVHFENMRMRTVIQTPPLSLPILILGTRTISRSTAYNGTYYAFIEHDDEQAKVALVVVFGFWWHLWSNCLTLL